MKNSGYKIVGGNSKLGDFINSPFYINKYMGGEFKGVGGDFEEFTYFFDSKGKYLDCALNGKSGLEIPPEYFKYTTISINLFISRFCEKTKIEVSPRFKVGDIIQILNNGGRYNGSLEIEVGSIVRIISIDESEYTFELVSDPSQTARYANSLHQRFDSEGTYDDYYKLVNNNTNMKKIIGYIAPMNLFDGRVSKGTIFKLFPLPEHVVAGAKPGIYYGVGCGWEFGLPKEIVETWEPKYEKASLPTVCGYDGKILRNGNIEYGCQTFTYNELQKFITMIEQYNLSGTMNIGGHDVQITLIKEIYSIYNSNK